MIEQYYIKKENKDGSIIFKPVSQDKITICGYSLEDIILILDIIGLERITDIKFTMKNLQQYVEIYEREMVDELWKRLMKKFNY